MEKMKRWVSALLTVCMLAVMLPMPAVSEEGDAPAPTQTASAPAADPAPTATQAEEQTSVSSSQPTATPVPTDKATATATPAPTDEATATSTPVPTDEATGTPAPVPTDEATATATPTPTDETTATATPVPTDEATGTPAPVPTDEATGTPAPIPTDEATGTPVPVPTDAAEVKTIASFEAVAPEGFVVPQGMLETDLGLPVSLNAQFSDGAAGEVPVAWQCAAGYDPSAEAGTQFIFAAVLPEGYALAEGVSLPQIFVTLTPPLANAMLAAQASGEGWTLSDDGKLTVTGKVESSKIPSFASVESIEVAGYANFTLNINAPFPGSITVMPYGAFINQGNVSGNISVESGGVFANFGTITGGTITGQVSNLNTGSITGGTFSNVAFDSTSGELTITGNVDLHEEDALAPLTIRQAQIKSVVVAENGTFNAGSASFLGPVTNNGTITGGTFNGPITNSGEITGGTFEGEVLTSPSCVISGGDFKNATAINGGGIINGGIFSNFTMDSETGKLTIPARST